MLNKTSKAIQVQHKHKVNLSLKYVLDTQMTSDDFAKVYGRHSHQPTKTYIPGVLSMVQI